ncbi:MAG: glycosyltransferase family 2 protein [Candidatus Blackburnbacteria bacterium]|nr:glycosyltransferase family 2 protein [Candidatus Blackburnbacteria bacterium]
MIKVFAVILNWNRKQDTIECLESIKKLTISGFQFSVVVVDNGSMDGSWEVLQSIKLPRIDYHFIENKENLGYAGGNNVGMKYALDAGADYVLVLNNDTIVSRDLVANFLNAAEEHKEVGIFSPKIYFAPGFEFHQERYKKDETGRVIWYAGGKFDWKNILGTNRGVDEVDKGQYNKRIKIDFATGACMFIRRELLEAVGLFDEKYFLYLEDVDLSSRAKRHNWKILYLPKAQLWHKVSRSSGIGSQLNDYYITRNRLLFGRRYASFRAKIALFREALVLLVFGREWQKIGVADFLLGKFGRGSYSP